MGRQSFAHWQKLGFRKLQSSQMQRVQQSNYESQIFPVLWPHFVLLTSFCTWDIHPRLCWKHFISKSQFIDPNQHSLSRVPTCFHVQQQSQSTDSTNWLFFRGDFSENWSLFSVAFLFVAVAALFPVSDEYSAPVFNADVSAGTFEEIKCIQLWIYKKLTSKKYMGF